MDRSQFSGAKRQRRQFSGASSLLSDSSSGRRRRQRRRQRQVTENSSSQEKVLERDDLLTEILTRLPTAKNLISCTAVSKRWNQLINHPYTISRWRPSLNPAAIFFTRYAADSEDVVSFTHIPLGGVTTGERAKRTTKTLTYIADRPQLTMNIEHSCNGLLICSTPSFFALYNPTTGRGTRFSGPIRGGVISMNLAFESPSVYKIIAVCRSTNRHDDQITYRIEILEPNVRKSWRNCTGVNFPNFEASDNFIYQYGVYMDGTIYWPDFRATGLMYLKVNEDKLVWLPDVPHPDNSDHSPIAYFGECRGRLRVVKYGAMRGATFDMLELKDDLSMWYIKYHVDLSPSLRLARRPGVRFPLYVLAILPGDEEGEEKGEAHIILHIPGQVVAYNFKDRTLKRVCDLGLRSSERGGMSFHPYSFVHSYSETLFRPPCKLTDAS